MLNFIKKRLFKPDTFTVRYTEREFPVNYFLTTKDFDEYRENGFVILRNCIPLTYIEQLEQTYHQLTSFEEFKLEEQFINSGRFRSPLIRNFVMTAIGNLSRELLPLIFNASSFDEQTTGAFQIKPPSKKSALNPHQDSPVIDETRQNALFVWIPLCDISEKNGPVWVLPKSHIWGNHQRSLNVNWIYAPYTEQFWKMMKPLYLNKGDILCWDTALVHASSPNLSNQTRVAITTTLLPKQYEMVEYFKDDQTPSGQVEKYRVEKSFWESEDIMKRPPCPPNEFLGYEKAVFS